MAPLFPCPAGKKSTFCQYFRIKVYDSKLTPAHSNRRRANSKRLHYYLIVIYLWIINPLKYSQMKIKLFLLFTVISFSVNAQKFAWAKSFLPGTTTINNYNGGNAI